MFKKFLSIFLCIGAAVTSFASRKVESDPNWTIYSAFDNEPRKIVDSPDAVYFIVNQLPYNLSAPLNGDKWPFFGTSIGAIFILDKNNPEAEMTDLNQVCNLSGTDFELVEIDPISGTIAIAYKDGGVDVVSPDRKVYYFDQIKKRIRLTDSKINGLSLDNNSGAVRVSCNGGFLEISTANFSVSKNINWQKPVTDVSTVGSRYIAIVDGKLMQADINSNISRFGQLSEIENAAGAISGIPLKILPLSDIHFAVADDLGIVTLATCTDGNWTFKRLLNDAAVLQPKNKTISNRLEHTVIPTAKGYYIASESKAYYINRPQYAGEQISANAISLPAGSTLQSASYDMSSFWFYRDRGQFVNASNNGSTWSEFSEAYRPNAPSFCADAHFDYSPSQGLVMAYAAGMKYNTLYDKLAARSSALVSTFRNGKWRDVSGIKNLPYKADTDNTLKNLILKNPNRYPVSDALGMCVDPLFPDLIYMGSYTNGFTAFNINDPREMPFLAVPSDNPFKAYANFTIPKSGWNDLTDTAVAGFDADNNMMVVQSKSFGGGKTLFTYYLTPESRQQAVDNNDLSLLNWKTISHPLEFCTNVYFTATVLRHPKNQGKILFAAEDYSALFAFSVFDYNNTLDDPSDDSLSQFFNIATENGNLSSMTTNCILENPVNGDVYVLTQQSVFIIDLDSPHEHMGTYAGRLLGIKSESGDSYLTQPLSSANACFDEYGRLWIATLDKGVVGINPVDESLVAHYTTVNSPIPSDGTRAVVWNPETKSLFIATVAGIAEVKVDAESSISADAYVSEPYAMPEIVDREYCGTVAVRNVPDKIILSVKDADGKIVSTLPIAENGLTHWDLIVDGKRVPAGIYYITDDTLSTDFKTIIITVK